MVFFLLGVRDHVCELCGSAYFSKKGLRKHERASHPAQKPSKPKPFKIGEDIHVQPVAERRGLELHELNRAGLAQHEFLNLEARHFTLAGLEPREQSGVGILGANHLLESKHIALGVNGVGVQDLNTQAGREEGFTLHRGGVGGGREGDMNLQMVYGSGLNRAGGDSRLTQFFSPLTNQN